MREEREWAAYQRRLAEQAQARRDAEQAARAQRMTEALERARAHGVWQ